MLNKTKRLYAQQLISNLYPTPTDDKKLEEQEAMLVVSQARDSIIKRYLYQAYQEERILFGNWLSTVNDLEIEYDEDRCLYYSHLRVKPISFISNGAIHSVWVGKNLDDTIKPVEANFLVRTKNRYDGLGKNKGYFLEGDRIYYVKDMSGVKKNISMRLVADSSSLNPDELFPIDGSVETEMMQLAMQFASTQKGVPQDIINDNISQ